jgi:predicted ribonuclease YlaK
MLVLPPSFSLLDAKVLISNPTPTSLFFNANFLIPAADIIEEMLSEEIVDETDNVTKQQAKRNTTAAVISGRVAHPLP